MMYLKSRYFTLSEVIQRLGPKLARNDKTIKKGNNRIWIGGKYQYQINISPSIEKLIKKSTRATTMMAVGTMSLGK